MNQADSFPPDLPIYRSLGQTEDERAWLRDLPRLVDEACRRWEIRTEAPFSAGSAAWVAPGRRGDGTEVVLKVGWPHPEARDEAAALRLWDGDGAVHLYAAEGFILLLERCRPGSPLKAADLSPEEALEAGAEVLLRLFGRAASSNATSFEHLGDVTTRWASLASERMERLRPPFDKGVVSLGIDLLRTLPASASREVVLHGDFNPGNLLASERQPWLAIDAKPMFGDPAYDPDPLVSQIDKANFLQRAWTRYSVLADAIGEPVERLIAWGVARRVESSLWALTRNADSEAQYEMHHAGLLASYL